MINLSKIIMGLLFVLLLSCNSDDDNNHLPDSVGEEITRVRLEITDDLGTIQTYEFDSLEDQDADQIVLIENTTYQVALSFWNDEESPSEDVTEEVEEEAAEHLVCYLVFDDTNLSVTRLDQDENGFELGLMSQWKSGLASNGGVQIVLKHQPDLKEYLDSEDCNLGETDVQVAFPVLIQ